MFDPVSAMRDMRNGNAHLSSADDHGRAAPRPPIEWQGHNVTVYARPRPNAYLMAGTVSDWEV